MSVTYTDAVRAEALAELLAGNAEQYVATKFNLPRRTLRNWRAKWLETHDQALTARETLPVTEVESLVREVFDLLHCNLHALKAMDELAADKAWLRKQDAQQIAILYGVMADKTHRWLAALQAGNSDAA